MLIMGGLLYMAQVISTLNFKLAQRLGIQENPEQTDALVQRAERYTAWWDVLMLAWMPFAGILMISDHSIWPVVALIAAAIYIDAAGRELMKHLSIRHEGFRTGSRRQQQLFMCSYVVMAMLGMIVLAYAIGKLIR